MSSESLAAYPELIVLPSTKANAGGFVKKQKTVWAHLRDFTLRWVDADNYKVEDYDPNVNEIKWTQVLPFAISHAGFLLVFLVGWSPTAVALCFALYVFRMFAVTGLYHRYFCHRAFKTSRFMQFIFGLWGLLSVQKGPIWWACHHRQHHASSDTPKDFHSPTQKGFFWSHIGWLLTDKHMVTDYKRVPDLAKFPELRFLNRFDWIGAMILATFCLGLGEVLRVHAPQLHTNAAQLFVWGSFVSTALLFNGTVTINSLSHVYGSRRYETNDTSRNNFWLALITLGEGWHNNHHKYSGSVRQGFYWWEIDVSYYVIWLMSKLGLVWDLNPVPAKAYIQED